MVSQLPRILGFVNQGTEKGIYSIPTPLRATVDCA